MPAFGSCCLQPGAAIPCPVPGSASSCPSPPSPAAPRGFGCGFRFSRSSCRAFGCWLGAAMMALGEKRGPSGAAAGTAWHPEIFLLLQVPASGGFRHPSAACACPGAFLYPGGAVDAGQVQQQDRTWICLPSLPYPTDHAGIGWSRGLSLQERLISRLESVQGCFTSRGVFLAGSCWGRP